jgi:hypothetical protein
VPSKFRLGNFEDVRAGLLQWNGSEFSHDIIPVCMVLKHVLLQHTVCHARLLSPVFLAFPPPLPLLLLALNLPCRLAIVADALLG